MRRIHARPSLLLWANNVAMVVLCLFVLLHLARLITTINEPVLPLVWVLGLLVFLTVLQAYGTFFGSELSTAMVGVLFAVIAAVAGIAAVITGSAMISGHYYSASDSFIGSFAICAYASFCSVVNIRRNTQVVAPPPAGICPVCGYDLRATPQRCPECGHAPRS